MGNLNQFFRDLGRNAYGLGENVASLDGCDAFRYMAVAFKESVKHKPIKKAYVQHGWMG